MTDNSSAPRVLLKALTSKNLGPGPELNKIGSLDVVLAAKQAFRVASLTIRGMVAIEYDTRRFFYRTCPTEDFEIFREHAQSIDLLLLWKPDANPDAIPQDHPNQRTLDLDPRYSDQAIFVLMFDEYLQLPPEDVLIRDDDVQLAAAPNFDETDRYYVPSEQTHVDSDRTIGSSPDDSSSPSQNIASYSFKRCLDFVDTTSTAMSKSSDGHFTCPATFFDDKTQPSPTPVRGRYQTPDSRSSSGIGDSLFGPGDEDDDEVVPVQCTPQPSVTGTRSLGINKHLDDPFVTSSLSDRQSLKESLPPKRQFVKSLGANEIGVTPSLAMSKSPHHSPVQPIASNFSLNVPSTSPFRSTGTRDTPIYSDDHYHHDYGHLSHPFDASESHIVMTRATDPGYQPSSQEQPAICQVINVGCRAFNHDLDQQRIVDNPAFKLGQPFSAQANSGATLLPAARLPRHLIHIKADEMTYREYYEHHRRHKMQFLYDRLVEWNRTKKEMDQALLTSPGMTSVARQAWANWWLNFQVDMWWLTPSELSPRGSVGRAMVLPTWEQLYVKLIQMLVERVDVEEKDWGRGFAEYHVVDDMEQPRAKRRRVQ